MFNLDGLKEEKNFEQWTKELEKDLSEFWVHFQK